MNEENFNEHNSINDKFNEELLHVETPGEKQLAESPREVPILPLRGSVVFPQTAMPLTIGQPRSIRLIDEAIAGSGDRFIGLVASKNPDLESPGPEDLFKIGTLATVHRLFRAPDGTIRLLVQGLSRFEVSEYTQEEPYLVARISAKPEITEEGIEIEALARNVRSQFEHISQMLPSIPEELVASISMLEDPLQISYTISNFQRMELEEAQQILEADSTQEKLQNLVSIMTREIEVLELGQKIQNEARSEIDKLQREYFLREQLKAIKKELGEGDEQAAEAEEFRKKIDDAHMTAEAEKQANRELERLSRLPAAAAEYGVIRTYLDWLVTLPWDKSTEDNLDIPHARGVLDQDHYGLEDIKDRIVEFLAIRKLRIERKDIEQPDVIDEIRKEREGVILCLIGPPGVGKTSLGQSIARALNRKFIRMSLGGVRDEAEIRGHRRTYIGSMPGRILQAIRRAESKNPIFMLDEIDKLSHDFHGDPASALLEVLDPEQNSSFRDHYLEIAFDLSQVMFITTANTLDTIPGPLLDRMEILQLSGYTTGEKINIAKSYLIPRQLKENALLQQELTFEDEAIKTIIESYTHEAGVRNLERQIGKICRKIATAITEEKEINSEITSEIAEKLLGRKNFFKEKELANRVSIPGIAIGLAWTPVGGDILFIEATKMPGGKGFQITGSIGKVMQESAQAALSYIRSHAEIIGLENDFYKDLDIHLHIPTGAQPKDGPSAGVTIAAALASLLTNRSLDPELGMTGEISLRGQVLPIGGLKEKVLAAHRAGLKKIILPKENERDLEDIPEEIRSEMQFILVDKVEDIFMHSFQKENSK